MNSSIYNTKREDGVAILPFTNSFGSFPMGL